MRLDLTSKLRVRVAALGIFVGLISSSFPLTATARDFILPGRATLHANYDPANEVDVELLLAVDVSQSMDTDEQEVQRAGYVAALTSDEVLSAVKYGPIGRIAVAYMEWGGIGEQFIVADWMVIEDATSAAAFATRIAEAPLRQVQRTSIAAALKKAVELVDSNKYEGLRRVIDISGDGPNNQGGSVTKTRDALLASGITINGLPLMMKANESTWQAMLHLDKYYEDCVIGGPGSFAIPVRSKKGFEDAIRMKLVMEIAGLSFEEPLVHRAAGRPPVRCSMFD
ncbi:DUF1194 domain-containing protein [Roseibium limicola]|uniref:DUF1194 domain-containing protein n=1 Tax=Roseibium limicola TaxID=2816037 RepID=A0A939EPN5_9HYPH|nr:DUF1194 domain-containing protein [Roseibium limicola]MBO0345661.1 DUF1194 domain-containing protein [Roseibium limicola]